MYQPSLRTRAGNVPVLAVRDTVGRGELARFQEDLAALMEEATCVAILDLTGCPFLCSPVFPLILRAHRVESGKALLVAVSGELAECFRLLRIDRHVPLASTRAACLDHAARLEARSAEGEFAPVPDAAALY